MANPYSIWECHYCGEMYCAECCNSNSPYEYCSILCEDKANEELAKEEPPLPTILPAKWGETKIRPAFHISED